MNSPQKSWKERLDNFLVVNLFVVIAGAFFFVISFIAKANGSEYPFLIFQKLWFPLFIPAFSLFFTAVLIEACINLLSSQELT